MSRLWLLLPWLLCWACAPAVSVENPSPFDEDDPAAQGSDDTRTVTLAPTKRASGCPPHPTLERQRTIAVPRRTYERVVAEGPGPILQSLEVKPRFADKRFIGWEILRFMPCTRRFDGIDLRPGDIVGAVNGRLLARPEHLSELWGQLGTASAVAIRVNRSGSDFELRFEVSEDAKSAMP